MFEPDVLMDAQIERPFAYDDHAVRLYHLGIGAKATDLHWVWEERLRVLPTFAVVPGFVPIEDCVQLPGFGIDLAALVHERQAIWVHGSLPTRAAGVARMRVRAIEDRRVGASVTFANTLTTDDGRTLATTEMTTFINGVGGCGNHGDVQKARPARMRGDADLRVEVPTSPDMAALYRLNGDTNPLHIDPDLAHRAGFERPILHGLASLGLVTRTVVDGLLDGDPAPVSGVQCRFANPVLPGQTVTVEAQHADDNQILMRALVDGQTVLKEAVLTLV
ncbi:MaoC/PaaZ C-terminal domain-containing protein [Stomatohabitans albus]|uniref:MaoC/PaaZ C-terminal domain-containing protein n=1 Tax=Stomatohabitans albus TaxID=3110766 RepID=UPI00300D9143